VIDQHGRHKYKMIENIMIGISFGTRYLRIYWEDNTKIDLGDTVYDDI
jgi:hypothetical protein